MVRFGFEEDEPPTTSSMSASRLLLLRFLGAGAGFAVAVLLDVRWRRCELDELRFFLGAGALISGAGAASASWTSATTS